MREKRVESLLTRRVKELGGWAVKIAPIISGFPDRMVILPGGRVFFVELKAPKKRVAAHQAVVHRKLATLGCPVVVLDTLEKVEAWVASHS